MKGKLIVIEAGDGCGKATQTELLYKRLKNEGHKIRQISFPNYDSPAAGPLKMYLNGEFGLEPDAVDAYAASIFFAVDRYASFKADWLKFYEEGGIVICDRYTTSNMVHQAVKIANHAQKEEFLSWLEDLEYGKMNLPRPDCVIFLDVLPQISAELVNKRAQNNNIVQDIHEKDKSYLEKCYESYLYLAQRAGWEKINCVAEGKMLEPKKIHEAIYKTIKPKLEL